MRLSITYLAEMRPSMMPLEKTILLMTSLAAMRPSMMPLEETRLLMTSLVEMRLSMRSLGKITSPPQPMLVQQRIAPQKPVCKVTIFKRHKGLKSRSPLTSKLSTGYMDGLGGNRKELGEGTVKPWRHCNSKPGCFLLLGDVEWRRQELETLAGHRLLGLEP